MHILNISCWLSIQQLTHIQHCTSCVIIMYSVSVLQLPCSANWVKIHGTKYQIPCAVVVGRSDDDDDELLFGLVLSILVYCKEVYFEFELLEAQYCNHYHAHSLSIPPASSIQKYLIKQVNLASFHPYGMYICHNISPSSSLSYTVLRNNIYT